MTFFVGVAVGAYVFLVGFAPTIAKLEVPNQEKLESLTIEGEVYGGCRDTCPSFQVLGDGSYRYLYSPILDEPQVIESGSLPSTLRRELQRNLTETALLNQSEPKNSVVCNSDSDGVDVRYTITKNSEKFVLDSCDTQVQLNSQLWLSIKKTWDYFETQTGE